MTRRETGKFHQEIAKLQALRISVRGDAPVESRHREPEKDSSTLVIDEGILIVNLVGRIDAISAPDLLQAYETIAKGGCFQEIRVEAEKMTYEPSKSTYILEKKAFLHEIESDKKVYGDYIKADQISGQYEVDGKGKAPVKFIFKVEEQKK